MRIRLIDIFLIFAKIGGILIGGGYVILPILQHEVVEKRGWITQEELVEFYAISQCIPGITATDVSMFIGYKLKGKSGAWSAGIGVCIAPFFTILLLALVFTKLTNIPIVQSAFWGIGVAIILLVFTAVKDMWKTSIIDKFTLFLFLAVLITSVSFNISPAMIILCAFAIGIIREYIKEKYISGGEK